MYSSFDRGQISFLPSPTCIKLGIRPPSRFCDQECFSGYWTAHTEVHKAFKKEAKKTALPPEFTGFFFTGSSSSTLIASF